VEERAVGVQHDRVMAAYCKRERAALAMRVFDEMRAGKRGKGEKKRAKKCRGVFAKKIRHVSLPGLI